MVGGGGALAGWLHKMVSSGLTGLLPPTTRPETTPVSWRPVSPLQPPSTSWKHGPDPTRTAQELLLSLSPANLQNPEPGFLSSILAAGRVTLPQSPLLQQSHILSHIFSGLFYFLPLTIITAALKQPPPQNPLH